MHLHIDTQLHLCDNWIYPHRCTHKNTAHTHTPLGAGVCISIQNAWLAHSQCSRQSGCSPMHDLGDTHPLSHAHYLTYKYN